MAFGFPGAGSAYDIVANVQLAGTQKFLAGINKLNTDVTKAGKIMSATLNASVMASVALFALAVKSAIDFEAQMANVNTLLDESDQNFGALNQGVLDIARNMPVSMRSLTKGLYDLVSAGVDSGEAIQSLELASMAATAGITSVDIAVRAGMSTINAYGLEISELEKIYDLQFSTVKKGVLTYEQLASSIGNVLPSAANLGVGLEDLHGAIAHITKSGIDAQSATTYLARAFESMVENRDDWKALGVSIFDTTGNFRGLMPVIGGLADKLEGLTTEQKMLKLESLDMEKRAAKAILTMVNNYDGLQRTMDAVSNSSGEMTRAFDKQKDTAKAQWELLKNKLQVVLIQIGTEALPQIIDGMKQFGIVVDALGPAFVDIVKLLIQLNSAMGLGNLFKLLKPLTDLMAKHKIKVDDLIKADKEWYDTMDRVAELFSIVSELALENGDALVRLGLDEMTASEAAQKLGEMLSDVQAGDLSHDVDELSFSLMDLGGSTVKVITAQEQLNESNIKTTEQILLEIAAWEKLIPVAGVEAPHALGMINDKINDLRQQIAPLPTEIQMVEMKMRDYTIETEKAGMMTHEINEYLKQLETFSSDVKSAISGLIDEMSKIGPVGNIASIGFTTLIESMSSGAPSITTILDLASQLAEAFGDFIGELTGAEQASQYFQNAMFGLVGFLQSLMDEFLTATEGEDPIQIWLDSLGGSIDRLMDTVNELPYTNLAIQNLTNQIENLKQQILDTVNSGGDPAALVEQLEELGLQLLEFGTAGRYDLAFQEMFNDLQGMIDYFQYFGDMYGEGAPGFDKLEEQLIAQMLAAKELLLTLDPTSDAYAMLLAIITEGADAIGQNVDLFLQLGLAIQGLAIAVMGGKIGERPVEEITDIADAFAAASGSMSNFGDEWEKLNSELMGGFDFVQEGMGNLTDFIDNLVYMGVPLDDFSDQINNAASQWLAYINTLDPNSQAYADAMAQYDELIAYLESLGYDVAIDTGVGWEDLLPGGGGGGGWGDIVDDLIDEISRVPDHLAIDIEVDYTEWDFFIDHIRDDIKHYFDIKINIDPGDGKKWHFLMTNMRLISEFVKTLESTGGAALIEDLLLEKDYEYMIDVGINLPDKLPSLDFDTDIDLHVLPPVEDINIINTMIGELHQNVDISLGIDNYTLVWDMVSNLTRDRTVDMTMTMDMESYGEIISLLDAIPRSINIGVTMTPPDLEAGPMPEAARISASNIVSSESGKGNTESVRILQPIIHEATPETWAEIVDTKVDPRFSETEKYTESGGYFR